MSQKIQIRRGPKSTIPTLDVGEPALTTDSLEFFLGSPSGNLSYAKKNQEGWISPTLLNGWVNYDVGWAAVGYYKSEFGDVRLKGSVKNGLLTYAVFQLPAGYRPKDYLSFLVSSEIGSMARVEISPAGDVIIRSGNTAFVDLSQIEFHAEQ